MVKRKLKGEAWRIIAPIFFLLNWPIGQFSPNVHLFVGLSVPSCGFFWFLCIFFNKKKDY